MPLPHFLRHFFCYDPFPDMLPRRERRKPSLMYFIPIADFNPRSREGSDQWLPILFVHSKISIHAPARGATEVFRITPSMKLFQSTLPRGERHLHRCNRDCRDDFNPRSREWSDARGRGGGAAEGISIHAPASGATGDEYLELLPESISIHAPASGATRRAESGRHVRNFNPRSREGSDTSSQNSVSIRSISIHAPARGATWSTALGGCV